ncbi:DUF748 domain-containing protein [Aquabacterium sp. J223]|uniref:DUF748 domain-containing protein n=1 Tax=Aquabacterium sp. J223 TaxID=2898431 RepID=UPI0021ADC60F|nr:DUF748 domain-containing protein [Aquabacterium sp. J223]UUX94299.1 DUF748 domain-containing protein [Aquabacterium sp. J223]
MAVATAALLLVVLGVLPLVLWAGADALLRPPLQARASQALGRPLQVDRLSVVPWRLVVQLDGVRLAGPPGIDAPALSADRVSLRLSPQSLWQRAPVVAALELERPVLRVARHAEGWDFDDLVRRLAAPTPEPGRPPARWALQSFTVRDGRLLFDDGGPVRRLDLASLQVELQGLSRLTSPTADDVPAARLSASALASGAQLTAKGTLAPFAAQPQAALSVRLDDLSLPDWQAWWPTGLPLTPRAGRLGAKADLQLHWGGDRPPRLQGRGELQGADLRLQAADGGALSWRQLVVPVSAIDSEARRLVLGPVLLVGAEAGLQRDPDGSLRWPGRPAEARATAAGASPPPWTLQGEGLRLDDARLTLTDRTRQPAAQVSLHLPQARLGAWRWPQPTPVTLQADSRWQVDGRPAARLSLQGEAAPAAGRLSATLDELDLAAFAPWRPAGAAAQLDGHGQASATLRWQGDAWQAEVPSLRLDALAWRPPALADGGPPAARAEGRTRGATDLPPQLGWRRLALTRLQVDGAARRIAIGGVSLEAPVAVARRGRDGRLDWAVALQALRPPPNGAATGTPAAAPATAAPGWSVSVDDARVEGGRLHWTDSAPTPRGAQRSLRSRWEALNVSLRRLQWPPPAGTPAPAEWSLSARVDDGRASAGGRLSASGLWSGTAAADPAQGRLQARWTAERLPLHGWERYVELPSALSLQRLLLGGTGRVDMALAGDGLRLAGDGELVLGELQLMAPDGTDGAPSPLLGWSALRLPGLQVQLAPGAAPRLSLGEAVLSDLDTRLVITEQGRFNLTDVAAPPGVPPAPPGGFGPAPRRLSPAPATDAPAAARPAVTLAVGGLVLDNGRINFTDRFVRPNYSAVLSGLQGRLGAFGTAQREPAALSLDGRIAGTGELKVQGQLNPAFSPPLLDIEASAREIELAPLSPYAGKYIGYEIDRGKLAMAVHYRVREGGELEASNRVELNQLQFGERVDSPDATRLPVKLAVSLLTDRQGRIQLDLPVAGRLGDPQFSLGGLVLKALGNLIVKAVTSPFALLAGIGGEGGGEQVNVRFLPGRPMLAPDAAAELDRLARALQDRPAVSLRIAGAVDVEAEREPLRRAVLEARLAEEQRRRGVQAAAGGGAAATPAGEERVRLLRALYRANPPPQAPRNALGGLSDLPPAELEAQVLARLAVDEDDLRELALQRGLVVREALVARGVASERLFLTAPRLGTAGESTPGPTGAVLTVAAP